MLCVIGKIDEKAREELWKAQGAVEKFGLKRRPLYGHVTLATFVDGDEAEMMRECTAALKGERSIDIEYEKIAELDETYIVVALLKKTEDLLVLQKKAVGDFDRNLDRWTHSVNWTPHTTLAHHPGMYLEPVCKAMQAQFAEVKGRIKRIEFSKVLSDGYEIVGGFDLED